MKTITTLVVALAAVTSSHAALIQFDLVGTAGPGLLAGNEPQPLPFPSSASGGEIGAGISYDDVANLLNLSDVAWGSAFGFTNLTSVANNSHLHGPTASPNGNGFTQTAGVLFNLTRSSSAATGGKLTDLLTLTAAQEVDLMNGKYYINIHTSNNGGGEVRGFLQPVPEPSTAGLLTLGVAGLFARRRKSRRSSIGA